MPMPVEILEFTLRQSNTLLGFAKIRLGKSMIIHDVALHTKNDKMWAQAPSKPQINSDGYHRIGDNGKKLYSPLVAWTTKEAADDFSASVVEAYWRRNA